MKTVTCAADIAVGDAVEVFRVVRKRPEYPAILGTVTAVEDARARVRFESRKSEWIEYATTIVAGDRWRLRTETHHAIRRLDAHDLWRRAQPSGARLMDYGVCIQAALVRDDLPAALLALTATSEWLAAEPSKDAP